MEKINNAREKITKESQTIGSPLANFIEEHINQLCTNEAVAEKVEAKSLRDLIKKIEDMAREQARAKGTGAQSAHISDADVIEMADEFYEIGAAAARPKNTDVIDVFDFI